MSNKTYIGLYLDESLLPEIDTLLAQDNCNSRNEFIVKALRFYLAFLRRENYSDILTPAYEAVIGAKIKDTENRLSRLLFKEGVELAMLMNIIAGTHDVKRSELGALRKYCIDELSKTNGKYSFEDALRQQKNYS